MADNYWTSTSSTDYQAAGNWSAGHAPQAGENVFIENNSVDIDTNLDETGTTIGTFNVAQSYTGKIGSSSAYLQIKCTSARIGYHFGPLVSPGSGRLKLDFSSAAITCTVFDSAKGASDANQLPIRLKFNSSSSKIIMLAGQVGLATDIPGETSTIGNITVRADTAGGTPPVLVCSPGVTHTASTLTMDAGSVTVQSAHANIVVGGGSFRKDGAGTITAIAIHGGTSLIGGTGVVTGASQFAGTATYTTTGTIGSIIAYGGNLNIPDDAGPRTITALEIREGVNATIGPSIIITTLDFYGVLRVSSTRAGGQ